MVPSTVEKEVRIEAPVEVVWQLVTEPQQIRRWLADEVDVDVRVGGRGEFFYNPDHPYEIRVEAMEPPRRFAFRWVHRSGLQLRDDNSLLVEFTLEPEGGATRLRVVETGFDGIDWSDEERARSIESHIEGWEERLGYLRSAAQGE